MLHVYARCLPLLEKTKLLTFVAHCTSHTMSFGRNMFQRIRWQACRRFASCPSCHGLGAYTTVKKDNKKRKLVPAKDRFKVPA